MSCKSITVIPPVFKFENSLGIKGRNLKVAFFTPNNFNNPDIHSTEAILGSMKFFDLVGLFISKKGFQRGRYRMRKIFVLYNKVKLDLLICNSKDGLSSYESHMGGLGRSILKCGIPIYCVKDCILIKNSNIIPMGKSKKISHKLTYK